jgi:hypothetical protein
MYICSLYKLKIFFVFNYYKNLSVFVLSITAFDLLHIYLTLSTKNPPRSSAAAQQRCSAAAQQRSSAAPTLKTNTHY